MVRKKSKQEHDGAIDGRPFLPWIGGKRRLAPQILPLFPEHTCYVEPFSGAAALFFMKRPSRVEVLNDVNGDLVNLYRVVKHHLEEFVRQFKWALTSRKIFEWARATPPETLTDVQRAARFFYLTKTAFGASMHGGFGTGTTSGPRINILRIEEDLSAAHLRLSHALIEQLDWRACIERYDRPHTLFYLDPPYWGTEGYGVQFGIDQYALIAATARAIAGKAIISVNDCPEMRQAFKGLRFKRLLATCAVNNNVRKAVAQRAELLIQNW